MTTMWLRSSCVGQSLRHPRRHRHWLRRPPPAEDLQAAVDRFVAAQPVQFSIIAEDRTTGVRATHLADRQVLSASLYKLFVAAELVRRIEDGTIDRNALAGDGSGRTVGECIRDMIVVSDNRCGAWGLRQVGCGRLDASLVRQGFSGTSLASPQRTTAADVALFFSRARDGTLLGPGRDAATAELYGLLRPAAGERPPAEGYRRARRWPTRRATASTGPTMPASSTSPGRRTAARRPERAVARALLRRGPPRARRGEGLRGDRRARSGGVRPRT